MAASCIIALLLTGSCHYRGSAGAAAVVTTPRTPSPKVPPTLPARRTPGGRNGAAGGTATWQQPSDSWQPELTLGARCLDGSPPGYYFRPGSGEGADAWHVHLPMGGWCFNLSSCSDRAKTFLGSSRADLQQENPYRHARWGYQGILSSRKSVNPRFYNWNVVVPTYCDGGGFSGRRGPVRVHGRNVTLYLEGWKIMKAVLNDLLTNRGLHSATSLLLSGASAGGQAVATFCGLLANSVARTSAVKCLLDSAFFTDSFDRNGYPYFQHMVKNMAELHESVGNPKCAKAQPPAMRWRCFFPQYALAFATPFAAPPTHPVPHCLLTHPITPLSLPPAQPPAKKWRCFFPQYALAFVTRRPVFIVQPLFDFRALVRGNQLPEDYGYVLNCLHSLLSLPVLPEKRKNPGMSRQAFDLAVAAEGGNDERLLRGWKQIEEDGYTSYSVWAEANAREAPVVAASGAASDNVLMTQGVGAASEAASILQAGVNSTEGPTSFCKPDELVAILTVANNVARFTKMLRRKSFGTFLPAEYEHAVITSELWTSSVVNGVTMRDAVANWYFS
ncbi:unnamed protein product [Closterium sp. Naga37s-1]|nr:unnamed protein product [Closterium sp. Naga37s-1]